MKFIICFLLLHCVLLESCTSRIPKEQCYSKARQLNDSAIAMVANIYTDTVKILKAIKLLNDATDLQSDFYIAYWNKLAFQRQLELVEGSLATLATMEQLKPQNPSLKTLSGILYEYYKKDTIQAISKYNEANLLYKSMLDTINVNSITYPMTILNYALNLKMLGQEREADSTMYSLLQNYSAKNKEEKEQFQQYVETFIKRTREELVVMSVQSNK